MPRLRQALDDSRPAIEAGLAEAERELAELTERKRELETLIARARAALGQAEAAPSGWQGERLTLHDAIAVILRESRNRWMTVRELADEVNHRGLYEKRDRSAVEPNQIHARTKSYGSLFEKDGPRVRLRPPPA